MVTLLRSSVKVATLWRFVKHECLSCRLLPTYEAFASGIDECLAKLDTEHKHAMDTRLTLEFQLIEEDVPVLEPIPKPPRRRK